MRVGDGEQPYPRDDALEGGREETDRLEKGSMWNVSHKRIEAMY